MTTVAPVAPMATPRRNLNTAIHALEQWTSAHDWAGPDPYDGLNAERMTGPVTRSALGRRIVTQAVKRSPVDLRPLFGIRPVPSSAALAHFASSYSMGALTDEGKLTRVLETMLELRCEGPSGLSFGYPFDVQTRVFFYPRGAPNTIATAFAGGALLDAHAATGDERWLARARDVGRFFLDEVPQTEATGGAFFGYLVGDRTPIHNANLLVCALLARLAAATRSSELASRAADGVAYTLAHQRDDGAWPYGEKPGLEWVDSFHTGYVLESLLRCASAGVPVDSDRLDAGLRYYREELFLADGTPKYKPSSLWPVDIQSVAQAIQTFALAAQHDPAFAKPAWRVFDYAMRRMRRADGAFMFQRRRFWANPIPHVRWGQAPMQHALAHLSLLEEGGS